MNNFSLTVPPGNINLYPNHTRAMPTIWNKVLEHVATRMNPSSFHTWFSPTKQLAFADTRLQIAVPDKYTANWLEEHYITVILEILKHLTGQEITVEFIIDNNLSQEMEYESTLLPQTTEVKDPPPAPPIKRKDTSPSPIEHDGGLNPKYTFDTYVVGNSNQFAHAASFAIAEQPSRTYNPLYIYGGVGLGKTHLMHAIGHAARQYHPGLKLYYLSFERFMNELINAIRYDTTEKFREKYRSIDLLLIDDIQFIAGKERTQEEFFHTFNALYDAQKQIVISSDCPPKKIPTLEERLRSRFEWGLIADIQPPDLETKIAILKKKAELENILLPNDVALFIATKIQSNIRALEGCLIKIAAHSTLVQADITVDLARKVLEDILETKGADSGPKITVGLIQQVVASHYKISVEDMKSSSRTRALAFPRQVAMYLSRKLTDLSLPSVGQQFGGKDHTTIMYACQKIEDMRRSDLVFQKELDQIEQAIAT